MKYTLILTSLITLLSSCADDKTIEGITYRPYGLFNEHTCKNDSIEYEVSGQAMFSGIVFCELMLIPTIYTFGYNLWEPVYKKGKESEVNKGVIN